MAVFLSKAQLKARPTRDYARLRRGSSTTSPACRQRASSDWIEELYNRGITGGCSVSRPLLYCPKPTRTNRGQMAVFLVKTFGLVLYGR